MKRRQINLNNPSFIQILKDFNNYINILGYSRNGAEIKYSNVLEFLTWLEQQEIHDITAVVASDIKRFYEYLKHRPHGKKEGVLSLKTIHGNMRSVRQLFAILQDRGDIIKNPTSTLKFIYPPTKKTERITLTIPEIKELYKVCETPQERAILSLSYGCGLRSMELVAVNTEDIKLNENILIVPRGKGNKRRVIPMSSKVKEDIANYYHHERPLYTKKEEEKIFLLNIKGDRLRKYTCRKILKNIIERTANQEIIQKNISIHNLRHSIATHLLEQGASIEKVRDFLGHSHLETTEIYTRVNQKQLKALIK